MLNHYHTKQYHQREEDDVDKVIGMNTMRKLIIRNPISIIGVYARRPLYLIGLQANQQRHEDGTQQPCKLINSPVAICRK